MTDSTMEQYEKGETTIDYTHEQMSETQKYLSTLKMNNKKAYNKLKKQGRKFSDTIMQRLK